MISGLLLFVTLAAVPLAQTTDPASQQLFTAAETYRRGDRAGAMSLLASIDITARKRVAEQIVKSMRQQAEGGSLDPSTPPWTAELVHAAGVLQMEAALDLLETRRRNIAPTIVSRVEVGQILLDEGGHLAKEPTVAPRWCWAIAQQAIMDGAFAVAEAVLTQAIQRYNRQPALLLAWGILHEAYSGLNVDAEALVRLIPSQPNLQDDRANSLLMTFRSTWKQHLGTARDAFEDARRIEPDNGEASLRLGHVRLEQGEQGDAARILEPLIARDNDTRLMYLSRLFLGRVRERQNRLPEALALFRDAASVMPAQSARLAVAHRLLGAGSNADARTLVEATTSDRDLEDPWWSYRLGQYWLVEPTLQALRARARR